MEEVLEALILDNDNDLEEAILQMVDPVRNINNGPPQEFRLNELYFDEVNTNFRFQRNHIPVLAEALRLPQ